MDSKSILIGWASIETSRLQVEQQLLDEAHARGVALQRPFEDHEVFGPIWEQGLELVPQMYPTKFALHQEATKRTRRLWSVVDMAELPL